MPGHHITALVWGLGDLSALPGDDPLGDLSALPGSDCDSRHTVYIIIILQVSFLPSLLFLGQVLLLPRACAATNVVSP